MFYIHPDECIDCQPARPRAVQAIFPTTACREVHSYIQKNKTSSEVTRSAGTTGGAARRRPSRSRRLRERARAATATRPSRCCTVDPEPNLRSTAMRSRRPCARRASPRRGRGALGITGLIHDFDWERHPTRAPPVQGVAVLRERGWPRTCAARAGARHAHRVPRDTRWRRRSTPATSCRLPGGVRAHDAVEGARRAGGAVVRKKMKRADFAAT